MNKLRQSHPVSPRGLTLAELSDIANALKLSTRAVRCEPSEMRFLSIPSILHWGMDHYVVLEKVRGSSVDIIDPAKGPRRIKFDEVSRSFTGIALELTPAPDFVPRRERSEMGLSSLISWRREYSESFIQIIILSLILQAYVVASPFYMQLAIDEAALKGDYDLIVVLAVGFGAFALFNAIAEALRGIVVQRLSATTGRDMTRRLFHHLIRLPLTWFQRRRLADSLTRFDSLTPIRSILSDGLVGALIDGALALVTLTMMLVYSPILAAVTLAGLAMYFLVRAVSVPFMMRFSAENLSSSISEQGRRLETLRAIQTIKAMGGEVERENSWANSLTESLSAAQVAASARNTFVVIQRLVDNITFVIVVYFGTKYVIDGKLTIGVLYAFVAYRTQFLNRVQGLFDSVLNWKTLDIYMFRIADIALTPKEPGIDQPVSFFEINGRVDVENISFSYAPHERPVFQDVSFSVEPGEFIAIVGPSGGGKSTLLKILSGLYVPTSGTVKIDGRPMLEVGLRTLRKSLGVVMQDDELLSGSIAENVAFFSDYIDLDLVWSSLEQAAIADEVRQMPMKLDTLVGDMGGALSGGQKQRILLARALYKKPKILLLDEATSHLDVYRERQISETLLQRRVTRIIVAHRPETIAAAERILVIDQGRLKADHRRASAPTSSS